MKKHLLGGILLLCAAAAYAQEVQSELNPQTPQTVVVVRRETPAAEPAGQPSGKQLPAGYDWRAHRQSVSFSVGLPSIYSTALGSHSWAFYIPAPGSASGTSGREMFCGAWGVDYGYNILRWLRLGACANYECWTGNSRTHDISLSARVDFTYINREHIRLYSGLSAGVGMHIERESDGAFRGVYLPAVNLTPIGLNFGGERVFGLVETNIGSASVLRVGIGFRP